MSHRLGGVAALPQGLRQGGEGLRGPLGDFLTALARTQTPGIGHGPFEPVAVGRVGQTLQGELVSLAYAVRPVGADAEPPHVRNDQKRRVLKRQGVLTKLVEGGVEIGVTALVLPGEVVALPYVGPAVAAGVLAGPALEAVMLAGRIGLGRRGLAQEAAQVDEVLLRSGTLLQLRRPPLGDELTRRHGIGRKGASRPGRLSAGQAGCPPIVNPRPVDPSCGYKAPGKAACYAVFRLPRPESGGRICDEKAAFETHPCSARRRHPPPLFHGIPRYPTVKHG